MEEPRKTKVGDEEVEVLRKKHGLAKHGAKQAGAIKAARDYLKLKAAKDYLKPQAESRLAPLLSTDELDHLALDFIEQEVGLNDWGRNWEDLKVQGRLRPKLAEWLLAIQAESVDPEELIWRLDSLAQQMGPADWTGPLRHGVKPPQHPPPPRGHGYPSPQPS
jgi:hypothetical protein